MAKNGDLDELIEKKQSRFVEFAKAYSRSKRRILGGIWDSLIAGSISYIEIEKTNKHQTCRLTWLNAYSLARKKLEETIREIEIQPRDRGLITASVYRSLDAALTKTELTLSVRKIFAREAIAGMYLLDLTNNKTLLRKIRDCLDLIPRELVCEIGLEFRIFDIIDEYHHDLNCRNSDVLKAVIESKLKSKKPRTDEEEFKEGFEASYNRMGEDVWRSDLNAAKIEYVEEGTKKTSRLTRSSVSDVAYKIHRGEITEIKLTKREQGRLYGSVRKSIDHLINPIPGKTDYPGTKEIVAGLYLLGRLDHPETSTMISTLLGGKPKLLKSLFEEIDKYET